MQCSSETQAQVTASGAMCPQAAAQRLAAISARTRGCSASQRSGLTAPMQVWLTTRSAQVPEEQQKIQKWVSYTRTTLMREAGENLGGGLRSLMLAALT